MIDTLLEKNVLPDSVVRYGIRRLLRERLRDERKATCELQQGHFMNLVQTLRKSPIAFHTRDANAQHFQLL